MSYTYDQLGRQLSQTIGGVASSVTYDTLGRVTTATNALSSTAFQYTYLANTGRVASVTNPNGQSTVYTYQDSTSHNEPRLSEIKNLNASAAIISKFDYGYDAQSQITSWTQQTDSNDPQNWANQYDQEGKLTGVNVTDTVTSAVLHQYAYLYDAAGNRTSEQIDGNVTGATFNSLNQLTGQSAGGKMVFSGSLSKLSQVTVGGNAATTSYSTNFSGVANVTSGTNTVAVVAHDVNNNTSTNNYQVVIPPASASFTYDLNGNLTQDATRSYQWDAKNEVTAIIYNSGPNAGNHTEFTYNGAGQRVAIIEKTGTVVGSGTITSTKQYVWAGGGIAEEHDGSNNVTKRYFGQGEQRIVSGVTTNYFYTRDHLGSIREMMASDGATIDARYSYDPYGRATQVSGSLSCDFQYAGMYEHATSGLNLTQFRAYDPNVGRWISRDPSGESSGLNLYAYCASDPINYSDLLGLDRSYADRAKQFAGGTLAISLSYVEFLGAIGLTASGFVDGPVGPTAGAYAGLDAGTGIFYGMTNMGAAFIPDTSQGNALAKTIYGMPASLLELIARATLGKDAQDLVSYLDLTKDILHADSRLESLINLMDLLNKLNEANDEFKYPPLQAPFAFPPSSCMDAMPAAFSATLHL